MLPEWQRVRLLPHASVVHRFTVDRHLVETCVEASRLIRRVARPDVLMAAALLHDIGKGELVDHSVAGEPLAAAAATRMGFDAREVDLVGGLVRWHLLLAEVATTRDLEDPATVGVRRRADPRRRDARPARGAHRGRRPGHLPEGVDVVARRAGRRPGPPGAAALADTGPAVPAEAPREVEVSAARARGPAAGRRTRSRPGRTARP